ncbi:efflux RND transporter periplasmic adaptor subunit [Paenibacillus sp. P36]|uniref:efflux RND transporter periplasmic adaptor subunit n=1 Tax=Paenibacillus sp. P36 TaxID=3342538 RepID=UPI0038B3947C
MDFEMKNGNSKPGKRWLHLVTVLMIAVFVISTLLSNTLYGMTLPKVTTQNVGPGQLDQTFKGSAFLKPMEIRELSGQPGWKVSKVQVQKGEVVQKGQLLVQYNNEEAQNQLQTEQTSLNKLMLSMEKLEYDYVQAVHSEDQGSILAAKAAVESAKLDITAQQKQISEMNAKLEASQSLLAPFDGKVAEINAKVGLAALTGAADILLLNSQMGYKISLLVPASITDSLTLGEAIEVQLHGQNDQSISGKVANIEGAEIGNALLTEINGGQSEKSVDSNQLTIIFQDASLAGNERAQVTLTKKGKPGMMLVSKASVRSDAAGAFVYTVEERKGPLGNAFHAIRRSVKVVESNDQAAAVEGLFPQEPVIVESSEPLLDGSRVRVVE